MSKLNELFCGAKQDKLTDKAFTQSITVCIMSILLCVVALCSVTWAWFSDGVSSNANSIQSANCDVTVSVTSDNDPVDASNGIYAFIKGKEYKINISTTGTAKSAYCILDIGGVQYYTVQIPITSTEIDGVTVPSNITFTLQFSDDTDVKILTRWGTSSQEKRTFANDRRYYVDLTETDPASIVKESTQNGTQESGETSKSTGTVASALEDTE